MTVEEGEYGLRPREVGSCFEGGREDVMCTFKRERRGAAAENDDLIEAVLQARDEVALVAVVARRKNNG